MRSSRPTGCGTQAFPWGKVPNECAADEGQIGRIWNPPLRCFRWCAASVGAILCDRPRKRKFNHTGSVGCVGALRRGRRPRRPKCGIAGRGFPHAPRQERSRPFPTGCGLPWAAGCGHPALRSGRECVRRARCPHRAETGDQGSPLRSGRECGGRVPDPPLRRNRGFR